MRVRTWIGQLEQALQAMPARARALLLLAVFLTFASITLNGNMTAAAPGFWPRVIATSLFSGAVGVGYAVVAFGYRALFPLVLALTLLGPVALTRWTPPSDNRAALAAGSEASTD